MPKAPDNLFRPNPYMGKCHPQTSRAYYIQFGNYVNNCTIPIHSKQEDFGMITWFPPVRPQHKNYMIINGAPCPNIREVNERSIDAGVALLTPSDSLKCKFQNKIPDFKTWLMEPTAKKGLFADSGRTWHFKDFLHFQQEIMDKYIQIHQLLHGNWFSIFLRIAGSPPTGFLGCSPRHQWSSGIFLGACTIPMLNILEAQDAKKNKKTFLLEEVAHNLHFCWVLSWNTHFLYDL